VIKPDSLLSASTVELEEALTSAPVLPSDASENIAPSENSADFEFRKSILPSWAQTQRVQDPLAQPSSTADPTANYLKAALAVGQTFALA
jgi:hypothetical protein